MMVCLFAPAFRAIAWHYPTLSGSACEDWGSHAKRGETFIKTAGWRTAVDDDWLWLTILVLLLISSQFGYVPLILNCNLISLVHELEFWLVVSTPLEKYTASVNQPTIPNISGT